MSGEGTKAGAVFWEFGADLTPFQQKLATAKSEATSEGSNAGGAFGSSFGSKLREGVTAGLGIGVGLGVASLAEEGISAIKDVAGEAVNAALKEQAANAALDASLQANVKSWNGDKAAIEESIKARERLGFTTVEQTQSLALLVGATKDVDKALALQSTAMDLATFKHISLTDASTALIKVEGGHYRALQELLGSTKDITSADQALTAVQDVTKGSAEALANTTQGKLNAANAKLEDSLAKIGNTLLPLVGSAAEAVGGAVSGIADIFGGFADIIGSLSNAVGGFIGAATAAGDASNNEAAATQAYNAALTELQVQFANGAISQDQYTKKSAELDDQFNALAQSTQGFTLTVDQASGHVDESAHSLGTWSTAAEDSARAWQNSAAETGRALDNIAGRSRAAAQQAIGDAHTLATALPREFSQASRGLIYNAGLADAAALAKGLRDGRGTVVDALNQFLTDQKQAAKLTAETGMLGGILASSGLARGLASNLPAVAGDAAALVRAVEAQLQHMPAFANAVGIDIANALAKGMQHIRDTAGPPLDGLDTSIKRTQVQASSGWKIAQGEGSPTDFTNILKGMGVVIPHVTGGLTDIAKSLGAIGTVGGGGGAAGGASKGLGGVSAASKAATQAAKDHKQALQDEASTLKDKLGTALDAAKTKALDYFARVHAANLAAITDSHNRATAEIADSKKIIDQHLAETEAADNKVVTDAEAAQKAIDDARQLRDLTQGVSDAQKQVADAQVGGDASAIASAQNALTHAQESLQDFQAQQQIAVLKATAETANAAAQTQADADKAKLDADQKAADDLAKQQTTAEDKRYKGQVAAFDVEWKALVKHLEDTKKAHTDTVAAIEKVYGDFNLQAEPVAKAFGTKYAAGLIASKKTIETNAAALAQVIADFLKTHSPAKRGPLHEHSPEDMAQGFVRSYAHSWTDAMSGFKPTVPSFAALTVPPPAAAATSGVGGAGTWSSPAPGSPGDPFAQYNAAQATRALQAGEMVGLKNSFAWYDQFNNNGAGGGLAANGQGGAADHGVHIEHVDIHNPVERTAGESMSDLMRTKTVLGGPLS